MDTDDLEPLLRSPGKLDLQMMSQEQLTDYIADMEAEITRVRDIIATKQDARGAADAVFKN